MKPLIDAVSGDRSEEAATDEEAGRPDRRGARQGGQRGSSCGRHGRSGPPHWVGMMSHMGPPCGPSWGSSWGPPCEPYSGQPCRSSCRPSCGPRCGPRCGQPTRTTVHVWSVWIRTRPMSVECGTIVYARPTHIRTHDMPVGNASRRPG